jgi:hypothetical protein
MTEPAFIKLGDLKRMATVAKSHNVTVWVEIDGRRVGVSPPGADTRAPIDIDDGSPENFRSLAEWKAWRDRKRAREAYSKGKEP